MSIPRPIRLLVLVLAGSVATAGVAAAAPPASKTKGLDAIPALADTRTQRPTAASIDEVRRAIAADGSARVTVGLRTMVRPESKLDADALADQRRALAEGKARLASPLAGTRSSVVRDLPAIPYLTLDLDADGLDRLLAADEAASIEAPLSLPSALAQSVPLIGAAAARANGFDGSGQTVAVIDSGVDRNHAAFAGRVVAEACFSQGADCPNRGTSQTGTGAGMPCTFAPTSCRHGSHVAGIAAGGGATPGVAPDARIIAVNATTEVACNSPHPGDTTCANYTDSDLLAALQFVYDQRTTRSIAAVNMSIGGSTKFTGACDTFRPSLTTMINQLKAAGIATVIASGNNGWQDGTSWPSCISSAVSVGSTDKRDKVSSFSNLNAGVDVLAPGGEFDVYLQDGGQIVSAVPGGSTAGMVGTSMAAPHVAGAFAVLRERAPSASVDTVLNALVATGVPVGDQRNAIYDGTLDISIDYRNACNQSYGTQSFRQAAIVESGKPRLAISDNGALTENNPLTLRAYASNPNTEGAISMFSSSLIPVSAGNTVFRWWRLGLNGASVSGTHSPDAQGTAANPNILTTSFELVPCMPQFGTLAGGQDQIGSASITGTVTAAAVDVTITGNVTTLLRPFTAHFVASRRGAFTTKPRIRVDAALASLPAGSVANDSLASAQSVTGASGSATGSNANATKQSGEPNHAGDPGGHSVWFQWTAPANGTINVDTSGSNFDTLLAMYTGTNVAALSQVAANDDVSTTVRTSRLAGVAVTSGTTYRIAVDGFGGATGSITVNWAFTASSSSTSVVVHWSAGEQARMTQLRSFYGMNDDQLVKYGIQVLAFINAIDPSPTPTPVTLGSPGTAGTQTVVWTTSELPMLNTVKARWVLNNEDAHRFGFTVLSFIAAIQGH